MVRVLWPAETFRQLLIKFAVTHPLGSSWVAGQPIRKLLGDIVLSRKLAGVWQNSLVTICKGTAKFPEMRAMGYPLGCRNKKRGDNARTRKTDHLLLLCSQSTPCDKAPHWVTWQRTDVHRIKLQAPPLRSQEEGIWS